MELLIFKVISYAFAFLLGCNCGYFLGAWFERQVKKFYGKND